jgi:YtkA-like protein
VRVAPRTHRHVLTAVILVCSLAAACAAPGCDVHWDREREAVEPVSVSWTLDPSPPFAGTPLLVRLTLRDREQKPITGARLRLEGVMSHPGMAPVTAAVTERGNGEYEAPLQFTMAGDWILVATGELPGGGQIKKQIEISGVRPHS